MSANDDYSPDEFLEMQYEDRFIADSDLGNMNEEFLYHDEEKCCLNCDMVISHGLYCYYCEKVC